MGEPRYFHLLWEEDAEELAPVLLAVRDWRAQVVGIWYSLYALHFGDSRSLSEVEFTLRTGAFAQQGRPAAGDMEAYARDVLKLGEELAERHVPTQEIVASLHLFEEASQALALQ